MYFTKGTIRVRIFSYYIAPRFSGEAGNKTLIEVDDLSTKPSMINEGIFTDANGNTGEGIDQPNQEFDCWVYSPIGGGRNYGMFHLPQVNERGIVTFLDGDLHKPLWMGSYFMPIVDPKKYPSEYKIKEINVPSDDPNESGNTHSAVVDDKRYGLSSDPNALVIRTKHTTLEKSGSDYTAKKIDWLQQNTDNLVYVGTDAIRLKRYDTWDNTTLKKYQEFVMMPDSKGQPIISTTVNNISDGKKSVVTQSDNAFSIYIHSDQGDFTWSVTGGDTGINLVDQFGNKIIGNSDGITIDTTGNSGSKIVLIADKETDIMGDGDNFVRYSFLKKVIDKLFSHVHITQGSAGPTSGAMDSSGAPSISTLENQDANDMKTPKVITSSS
jgi:hypothetical protein